MRDLRPLEAEGATTATQPPWISSLGAERPAVYMTFGTEMSALAPWPVVLEALGTLDVDAVVTTGDCDPHAWVTPPNIRVERYVPQSHVLGRVAAVVSHAGAGTMLATAAIGVGQLCLPIGADQWENADAITGAGAAMTLEGPGLEAGEIAAALGPLLVDSTFADAARQVAGEMTAMPSPGEQVRLIEALVG